MAKKEFCNGVFVKVDDKELWVRLKFISTVQLKQVNGEEKLWGVDITLTCDRGTIRMCTDTQEKATNYYANLMEIMEEKYE
jgi:hypothetical protein